MNSSRRASPLKTAAKAILFLVVVYFVGRALAGQVRQIEWSRLTFRPLAAAGAVACLLGVSLAHLASYGLLLAAHRCRLPLRVVLATAWIPPLGKYIPGKVASIAGSILLLKQFGVAGATALGVAIAMDGFAVLTGLIAGSPLLLWAPVQRVFPLGWLWCALAVVGGAVCLHPRVFGGLVDMALRRMGRPALVSHPRLRDLAAPLGAAFAQWVFWGLALWLMGRSLVDVSPGRIPLFIAIAALGNTIGYLVLFAPGGLGVREGIFQATLGGILGPPAAIAILALRLVQTIIEAALAIAGFALLRRLPASPVAPPAEASATQKHAP